MTSGEKIDERVIAVDFDGTCVTHEFPKIGKDIGAAPVLKMLADKGHFLILYTMRSGELLKEAVAWFEENGIPLLGINENPTQHTWTQSPKVYAHTYIDDAALGIPLILNEKLCSRPFVDWHIVEELLKTKKYL